MQLRHVVGLTDEGSAGAGLGDNGEGRAAGEVVGQLRVAEGVEVEQAVEQKDALEGDGGPTSDAVHLLDEGRRRRLIDGHLRAAAPTATLP